MSHYDQGTQRALRDYKHLHGVMERKLRVGGYQGGSRGQNLPHRAGRSSPAPGDQAGQLSLAAHTHNTAKTDGSSAAIGGFADGG